MKDEIFALLRSLMRAGADRLAALQATVIPPADGARWPLHLVIAVMCFLASVALGVTLTVAHVAEAWSSDLVGVVTVQIKPQPDAEMDDQMARALEIIRETPGIASASRVPASTASALLEPWIGTVDLPEDIAVPQLIDVRLDPSGEADLEALGLILSDAVPGAELDDHFRWKSRLTTFAASLEGLALAALILIVAATVAIVVYATRAAMEANREIIEVLHLIGAKDSFIAKEFQSQFLWVGLRAGAIGAAAAAVVLIALAIFAGGGDDFFLPGLGVTWTTYPSLLLVPLLAAAVALITARMTALSVLGRTL
jgi:cell division transport system permease protein